MVFSRCQDGYEAKMTYSHHDSNDCALMTFSCYFGSQLRTLEFTRTVILTTEWLQGSTGFTPPGECATLDSLHSQVVEIIRYVRLFWVFGILKTATNTQKKDLRSQDSYDSHRDSLLCSANIQRIRHNGDCFVAFTSSTSM